MATRLSILITAIMAIQLAAPASAGFLEDLAKGINKGIDQVLSTPSGSQVQDNANQQEAQAEIPQDLDKLKRRIDALKRNMPAAPAYLYSVDTTSDAIATVWMDLTDKLVSDGARRARYDEFYYTSLDYRNLAQIALGQAEKAANRNDAWRTGHQLQLADRYLKLHNLTRDGATALYLGHIDEAYDYAKAIYDMSQSLVKLGSAASKPIIGPYAGYTFDLLFLATDYMIDNANAGIDEAARKAAMKILVKAAFDAVPLKALNGKTIGQFMTDKTGSYIGKGIASSRHQPIINELLVSPEFLRAFRSTLATSVDHLSQEKAKRLATLTLDTLWQQIDISDNRNDKIAGNDITTTSNISASQDELNFKEGKTTLTYPGYLISGLAFENTNKLWAADWSQGVGSKKFFQIDVTSDMNNMSIPAPTDWPGGLAYAERYLWSIIVDDQSLRLLEIDPSNGTMRRLVTLGVYKPSSFYGLAFDGTGFWTAHNSKIIKHNKNNGYVIKEYKSPAESGALAYDGRFLWFVERPESLHTPSIFKIDPLNGSIVEQAKIEGVPNLAFVTGLAFNGKSMWAAFGRNNSKSRGYDNWIVRLNLDLFPNVVKISENVSYRTSTSSPSTARLIKGRLDKSLESRREIRVRDGGKLYTIFNMPREYQKINIGDYVQVVVKGPGIIQDWQGIYENVEFSGWGGARNHRQEGDR